MTTQRKWLMISGLVVAAIAAFVIGVSPGVLLIVGIVLLCPLAMYFGMGGMHKGQGSGHVGMSQHSSAPDTERKPEGEARQQSERMK